MYLLKIVGTLILQALSLVLCLLSPYTHSLTIRFHLTSGKYLTYYYYSFSKRNSKEQEFIDLYNDVELGKGGCSRLYIAIDGLAQGSPFRKSKRLNINPNELTAIEIIQG